MKKLFTTMLAVAGCMAFTSCSNDDDNNNNPNPMMSQNLTGAYQLTSANAPSEQDYDNDGDRSSNLVIEGACYNDSWISFHSDGTYDQGWHSSTTGAGGLSLECQSQITSGTYTRNGNTIVTYVNGGTDVSATYNYDAVNRTLTQNDTNGSYSAWNAATSLWVTLTGNLQLTYTKYTDNDQDNGASADTDGPNDDENNANFYLLGTLNLSSYIVATAQNLDGDSDSSTNLTTESSCYAGSQITFNSNGTYERRINKSILANLGLSLTCDTEITTGTWTRNGNTITTHRTSSGSGSVNVNYTFNSATRVLTGSDSNGDYPSFNSVTSLWAMLTGNVTYSYMRSDS
ncbi:MAG TPA: hypothetical protein PLS51_10365 [Flavobacterium sp.]|nr:hypothetical protein [Flavobacterium sp.]HPJ11025.1 hypothetical protein [Flavobacterium sp.]